MIPEPLPDAVKHIPPNVSEADIKPIEFCARALAAGEAGMQAAELALQKSPSADVRAFAMVALVEQCQVTSALQSLASRKCSQLRATPVTRNVPGELQCLVPECFDAVFAISQVATNEAVVELLARSAMEIDDLELQAFARDTLPVFEHRLEEALALAAGHPLH